MMYCFPKLVFFFCICRIVEINSLTVRDILFGTDDEPAIGIAQQRHEEMVPMSYMEKLYAEAFPKNEIIDPITTTTTTERSVVTKQPSSDELKEFARSTCIRIDDYISMYKIADVDTVADKNCNLIRTYFPELNCKDIRDIMKYCMKMNFTHKIENN